MPKINRPISHLIFIGTLFQALKFAGMIFTEIIKCKIFLITFHFIDSSNRSSPKTRFFKENSHSLLNNKINHSKLLGNLSNDAIIIKTDFARNMFLFKVERRKGEHPTER